MSSDTEVFIPEQACVITVPVHSLPSSIKKKMPACPVHSDQPATFISPVELREKGKTHKPRPLTPGQFFLPVVTSNHKAFKILQKFLQSGENPLRFSEGNSPPGSAFSKRKNSIILFNTQVFLIVRKAKASDWLLEQRSSTPSGQEAPPLNSPQFGGSDITKGRSKAATCDTEDRGKDAEKRRSDEGDDVMRPRETQDDDITDRGRSKDGAGAAEDHGKCVIKGREADAMKDGEVNNSLTQDMSTNTPSISEWNRAIKLEQESGVSVPHGEAQSVLADAQDQNGAENQIPANFIQNSNPKLTREQRRANETQLAAETQTGNENSSLVNWKHSDGESLVAKAKCCKQLVFSTNESPSLTNTIKLQDKSNAKEQSSESEINSAQIKVSVGAAEVQDAGDDIRDSQIIIKDVNITNSTSSVHIQASEGQRSRQESAAELVDVNDDDDEMQILADETNASRDENLLGKSKSGEKRTDGRVTSRDAKQCKSDDIAMETSPECDDLIIVESCGEVKSETERSETEVVKVDGSSANQPSRRACNNKHLANKTSAKAEREVRKVVSASDDDKSCESSVEIIDSEDDYILHQKTNDANRDATSSKSGGGVKSRSHPSPLLKRCESAVDCAVVDLNKDDDVIVNNRNVNRHQIGDTAKACKRRILDETDSGVAASVQISDVSTLTAKRLKQDGDDDAKGLEHDVDPNCQVKIFNHDVEIIEVNDDEDDDDDASLYKNNSSKAHVSAAETLLTTSSVEIVAVRDINQLSRKNSQDDANVGKDKRLASASFTDNPYRLTEPQTTDDASPSTANQGTAVDSLQPTCPRTNQVQLDYKRLSQEENISRIRARLRKLTNDLHTINNSHS